MKKMYTCSMCWLALFFIISGPYSVQARTDIPKAAEGVRAPADKRFDEPLARGLDYVFSDQYELASALFDSLQKTNPDHPAPFFYKAATLQSWMSSYRFNKFQKELEENVQKAIDKGNVMLEKEKDDPWLNFYVGAAYGYRGFHRFRQHNWIGAYTDGNKGVGNFEKALDKLPELYDCYLGIGTYHYWRTAKSSFLRVIAFWMKDRRDLGLDQIRFSIDHGRYCSVEATFGLIIAYYDHKEFDKAAQLNQIVFNRTSSPVLPALYMRGRLDVQNDKWVEAEKSFRQVLSQLESYKYPSIGYQIECKYWIANALYHHGKSDEAFKVADDALKMVPKRDKDAELENPIDNFNDIKSELDDLYKELKQKLGK